MHAASLRHLHSHSYRTVPSAVRFSVCLRPARWAWHPLRPSQGLGHAPMRDSIPRPSWGCLTQQSSSHSSTAMGAMDTAGAQFSVLEARAQTEGLPQGIGPVEVSVDHMGSQPEIATPIGGTIHDCKGAVHYTAFSCKMNDVIPSTLFSTPLALSTPSPFYTSSVHCSTASPNCCIKLQIVPLIVCWGNMRVSTKQYRRHHR